MILKKHKNTLLTIIRESGFDPTLFSAEDETIGENKQEWFVIRLRNSPIRYAMRPYYSSFDTLQLLYSDFSEGFPSRRPDNSYPIQAIFEQFKHWLDTVVRAYLDELGTPDLWQMLEHTRSDAIREIEEQDYSAPFSQEQKDQLRDSIKQLRLLIADKFNVQEEQLGTITSLLKHLSDSVDKQSKFDWRGIAINVASSIALHLTLNPEQTRQLFQLFAGLFSNITHLLP